MRPAAAPAGGGRPTGIAPPLAQQQQQQQQQHQQQQGGPRPPAPEGPPRTLHAGGLAVTSSAVGTSIRYTLRPGAASKGALQGFLDKLVLAWRVFFPPGDIPAAASPKDGAKQRLRMILVADRCGLSPSGLSEMKRNIVRALEDFVDIESEEEVDVSITLEPDLGTIYCVAVPVRRVKPEARFGPGGAPEGAPLEWDPADKDSDPSSRFPMGC